MPLLQSAEGQRWTAELLLPYQAWKFQTIGRSPNRAPCSEWCSVRTWKPKGTDESAVPQVRHYLSFMSTFEAIIYKTTILKYLGGNNMFELPHAFKWQYMCFFFYSFWADHCGTYRYTATIKFEMGVAEDWKEHVYGDFILRC